MKKNKKTPKVVWVVGLILIFTALFCFLIFETDVVYDIDISNFSNIGNDLKRPISVEEVIRQLAAEDGDDAEGGGDEGDDGDNEGGGTPKPVTPTPSPSPGPTPAPTPPQPEPGSPEEDIAKGLYTREDLDYLVALAGEASDYNGFYAVACCVRNRCQQQGKTVKQVVTAPGQFTGYSASRVGDYSNKEVFNAAVAVLRGGSSTISDYIFFLGRKKGYDLWYESKKCGSNVPVVVGSGEYRNVFFKKWGDVHNSEPNKTSDAVVLYRNGVGWVY